MNKRFHTIKHLKNQTGCTLFDAKKALDASKDSYEAALDSLRASLQIKPHSVKLVEGSIGTYLHTGSSLAVMVDVRCETEELSSSNEFKSFVHALAMHIAAMHPLYLSRENIPENKVKEITDQILYKMNGFPNLESDIKRDHFIKEKLIRKYGSICLLDQRWIHDDTKSVAEAIIDFTKNSCERIEIRRWERWQIDEG